MVAIARREADKRGFGQDSDQLVQIVTDGDNDLERYLEEFFSEAIHTIDVYHATEYLWEAGHALYKEGSDDLEAWVATQKGSLYEARVVDIMADLDERLA